MKKNVKISILTLFLLVFTLIFSARKVSAYEITLAQKAENAGNPISQDIEYVEGVTLYSDPLSDLTYLEIPYTDYAQNDVFQLQVITFSEALYYSNDKLQNDLVMYVYFPYDYMADKVSSVRTSINLKEQTFLTNGSYIDNVVDTKTYDFNWTKVSSNGYIVKFACSKATSGSQNIKNKILNNSTVVTATSTVFGCKVTQVVTPNKVYYKNQANKVDWISGQEFNYIYEKKKTTASTYSLRNSTTDTEHYNTVIAYNEGTAVVDGVSTRLRFKTSIINRLKLFKLATTHNETYTDFFYYFFNVYDAMTGNAWTGNEILKSVSYTYYELETVLNSKDKDKLFGTDEFSWEAEVSYVNKTGTVLAKDKFDSESYDKEVETLSDLLKLEQRNADELKSIYQHKTVTPTSITNKYPKNNFWSKNIVSWFWFLDGPKPKVEVTLPTLFSTKNEDLLYDLDQELLSDVNFEDYMFGMMIGKSGYLAENFDEVKAGFLKKTTSTRYSMSTAKLVCIDEINYEYEGERYTSKVVESIIDDTNIYVPNPIPGDPNTPQDPPIGEDPSDDKSLWERIWEELPDWLKNIINKITNLFNSPEKALLNIAKILAIALAAVILIKLSIRLIFNTATSSNRKRKNKKE